MTAREFCLWALVITAPIQMGIAFYKRDVGMGVYLFGVTMAAFMEVMQH